MNIVIIDYGAGNIQSIEFALNRLGYSAELTDDPQLIQQADKVIFPGVGEASSAMAKLKSKGLDQLIPTLKQPVLGICLGMQLMCTYSEEGSTPGLGIFKVDVQRFDGSLKVPQMGWNQITDLKSPLFTDVQEASFMYSVHSYYVPDNPQTIASSTYGFSYAAAMAKDNFYAVQFHPEKSSKDGSKIIANFLNL